MLSDADLERLIAEKRCEIEKEKIVLGLSPAVDACHSETENKENQPANNHKNGSKVPGQHKTVRIKDGALKENVLEMQKEDRPEISQDLERYIRRYLGLPVMLKAGEFSPNNPLVRSDRAPGDVMLGLGEYERRRNTLRRIRQQQYREYLDQQAKKKQEAKEQAEKERREREEKERQREEELERIRLRLEQETLEAERSRYVEDRKEDVRRCSDRNEEQRRSSVCYVSTASSNTVSSNRNKVDTGVQVGISRPLSVAVQTDDIELYRLSPTKAQLTQAERELSPRTVVDQDERPIHPAKWTNQWREGKSGAEKEEEKVRRRSYGDYDVSERPSPLPRHVSRSRLLSDLRHTYMPSIFDADAIQMRNLQAEKEAAERRQFYQQELKNQILEQQRIREERKTREKMLEMAEMRRLEEQLRMLRAAQSGEDEKLRDLDHKMKESSKEFERKRTNLRKEIDDEHQKLIRAPHRHKPITSHSDTNLRLPTFHNEKRQPFSTNISENSIFNPNYDVDSYLRKNLNPKREIFNNNFAERNLNFNVNKEIFASENDLKEDCDRRVVVEKALVHDRPKEKAKLEFKEKPKYEPSFLKNLDEIRDETPIPVLRHSPKNLPTNYDDNDSKTKSDGMKLVEDKWKVPAVQKNILKNISKEDGRNVSILTQLGSIRRQLQLEQLRLDNMTKSD